MDHIVSLNAPTKVQIKNKLHRIVTQVLIGTMKLLSSIVSGTKSEIEL